MTRLPVEEKRSEIIGRVAWILRTIRSNPGITSNGIDAIARNESILVCCDKYLLELEKTDLIYRVDGISNSKTRCNQWYSRN